MNRANDPSPPRRRMLAGIAVLALVGTACAINPGALPPPLTPLQSPSRIYDVNGVEITRLAPFGENRLTVANNAIPTIMKNAVVAAEDGNFYRHGGIDFKAIARAFVRNVETAGDGGGLQGGSTITQQLAEWRYSTDLDYVRPSCAWRRAAEEARSTDQAEADPEPTAPPEECVVSRTQLDLKPWEKKVREANLARALEANMSKDEILSEYLNRAYFGARAYGVAAASLTYFNKRVQDLTLGESSLLAGLVRSPGTLNPFENPDGALARREYVLDRMVDARMIARELAEETKAEPLALTDGSSRFRRHRAPYFVQWIEQQVLQDPAFGENEDVRATRLYTGGLDIRTTLNARWQTYAEEAIAKALPDADDPEAALVAIDTRTGAVRAMVGGRDFDASQFNSATDGKRQPGSSFKPFVVAAALRQGIALESRYESSPAKLKLPGDQVWEVDNSDGQGRGYITIEQGLVGSVNGVFARLVLDLGPDSVAAVAADAGIPDGDLVAHDCKCPVASIALGTVGVTPLHMATAYAPFANGGNRILPHGISLARDRDGTVLKAQTGLKTIPAIDPAIAYRVTELMERVICCGTATRAQLGRPAAGKTGTTDDRKDVWFVGFTPDVVTAVWVGHRNPPRPLGRVHGVPAFGGTIAAPIWKAFMEKAVADMPVTDFVEPAETLDLKVKHGRRDCFRASQDLEEVAARDEGIEEDGGFEVCPSASPSTSASPVASVSPSPSASPPPDPSPTPEPSPEPPPPPPSPEPTPSPSPAPKTSPEPASTPAPGPSPSGSAGTSGSPGPSPSATPSPAPT